jgi:DUF4097 and DUF4098 domain-containing protein YvlB
MRKRAFIILILITFAMSGPIASAQDWQQTPRPPQQPRVSPPTEQKEKDKVKVRPTPAPYEQEPDKPIEPLVRKVERGMKIGVTSRTVNVNITGWDRDTLQAVARNENGPVPVEAETEGQKITLYVPAARVRRPSRSVTLDIQVPRYAELETIESNQGNIQVADTEASVIISSGTGNVNVTKVGALKLGSRGGSVSIKDVRNNIVVRSTRGTLTIEDVAGKVDLEATHGNVGVRNVGGDVRANSWFGNLEVHCAGGRADLTSVNGSITIAGAGGDVDAKTTNGQVSFTGSVRNDARYNLKSLSGQVGMTIQPDAPGFRVDLNTYNGDIETDFPIKKETQIPNSPINRSLRGTYKGGGGIQITLDSFSGGVRLKKAASGALKECK